MFAQNLYNFADWLTVPVGLLGYTSNHELSVFSFFPVFWYQDILIDSAIIGSHVTNPSLSIEPSNYIRVFTLKNFNHDAKWAFSFIKSANSYQHAVAMQDCLSLSMRKKYIVVTLVRSNEREPVRMTDNISGNQFHALRNSKTVAARINNLTVACHCFEATTQRDEIGLFRQIQRGGKVAQRERRIGRFKKLQERFPCRNGRGVFVGIFYFFYTFGFALIH
ncbi:MAG: hypothetical protein VCB59_02625 [Gammaproteobacteria bacterium]